MLPEQKIWLVVFARVLCLYVFIIAIEADCTDWIDASMSVGSTETSRASTEGP